MSAKNISYNIERLLILVNTIKKFLEGYEQRAKN